MLERLTYCRREREWQLEVLEALVRLESPSTDKAAVDRCGRELAHRVEALGAGVERLPQASQGDHLRAALGDPAASPILLLGHFDTVWDVGAIARMPFHADEGRLHGPTGISRRHSVFPR